MLLKMLIIQKIQMVFGHTFIIHIVLKRKELLPLLNLEMMMLRKQYMKFKIHQQNGLDSQLVAKIKIDIQDLMVYCNKFSSVLNLEFSWIMLKMLLENYNPKRNNQKISYQNQYHIKLFQIHYKEKTIASSYLKLIKWSLAMSVSAVSLS